MWRSATVNDEAATATNVDNWHLEILDRSDSTVTVLGAAAELNYTGSTPRIRGQRLPTVSVGSVYFVSAVQEVGAWTTDVLRYPLPAGGVAVTPESVAPVISQPRWTTASSTPRRPRPQDHSTRCITVTRSVGPTRSCSPSPRRMVAG